MAGPVPVAHNDINEVVTEMDVTDVMLRHRNDPNGVFTPLERSIIQHVTDGTCPCPNFSLDYSGLVSYLFKLVYDNGRAPLNRYAVHYVLQEHHKGKHPCRWSILLRYKDESIPYANVKAAKLETEVTLQNLFPFDFERVLMDRRYYWKVTFRMAKSSCSCSSNFLKHMTQWSRLEHVAGKIDAEVIELIEALRLRARLTPFVKEKTLISSCFVGASAK